MKRPILILIALFITTLSLMFLKIVVANRITTNGIELGVMQNKIQQYDTQNLVLQEQLLSYASLHTISEKAGKMGFIQAKSDYFVAAPLHVAIKQ